MRHIQESYNLLEAVRQRLNSAEAAGEIEWSNWIELCGQVQHLMDIIERDHDVEYMG